MILLRMKVCRNHVLSGKGKFLAYKTAYSNFKHSSQIMLMSRPKVGLKISLIFGRNATHCISSYAIVMCVCVCVSLCLSFCVLARLWTPEKRFEIETSFFFKLCGMTPDKTCKSFTQIGLQIPIWWTKWQP